MVGLLDLDLYSLTSAKRIIPNLEIMKLATYYRLEKNQFCRLLSPEETDLTNYEKIYCFSESHAAPVIPPAFLREPRVIYGGTGFTNGVYIPFEDEIIDFTLPKPTIYKEYLKQQYNDGIKAKVINRVLDNSYYRFYAKEKLPIPPIMRKKNVIVYDINFFCPDWKNIIENIEERHPSSIICLHPIVCKTITDFFDVRNYVKISRENNIILDLNIPLDEVYYMLNKYKKFLLAEINPTSTIFIKIGDSFPTATQYKKDLIYKLNLLYCFWSYKIPMKIWYEPPRIGFNNPIEELDKKIAIWSLLRDKKTDVTINDRITYKTKKSEWIEERDIILKFFPKEKILFNQSYDSITSRGRWRYEY